MNLNQATLHNTNLEKLMQVIDSCEGAIWMITEEGDRLNMKSKLSQIIGIRELFTDATIKAIDLKAERDSDWTKLFRFMLYGDIS